MDDLGGGGGGTGGGRMVFQVAPETLREASQRVAAVTDRLEANVVLRLRSTMIEPAGADAVNLNAAQFSNAQINGGYEAQEAANADAFRQG